MFRKAKRTSVCGLNTANGKNTILTSCPQPLPVLYRTMLYKETVKSIGHGHVSPRLLLPRHRVDGIGLRYGDNAT